MYQKNLLVQPGGITVGDVKIDLRKNDAPVCFISTREDHIAPWKSTYAATQIYSGPITFILAGSGHVVGVVNPPAKQKYNYWIGTHHPADPDQWLEKAKEHPGSWWPEWQKWLASYSGEKIPARKPGSGKLKALEEAPGSYVKGRS
jgi:polyhydroxyalkanoate synthase